MGVMGDTQAGLVKVPWLQDEETRDYNRTLGEEKDRLICRTRAGVKMRWTAGPQMQLAAQSVGATLDPTAGDAQRLALIGAGFNLPRLGSQTDAQYEGYLESAWSVHQLGGTPASITNALNAYGIPDVEIVEEWQDMGGTWACPGGYGHRVCVLLGPDYGTLGWGPMGFPLPLPIPVLGIAGMTLAQLQDIARLVRRWKDAGCTPVKLVFRFRSTPSGPVSPVFDPAGVAFPIPFTTAPEAVTFYMTGHYLGETDDGVPLPLTFGPVYTLDGTS